MLTRREVLRTLTAAGLVSAAGAHLAQPRPATAEAASWKTRFDTALASDPSFLGWQTALRPAFDAPDLALEGRLPEELAGTFYRVGPAQHERAGLRYRHWFDGDGMVQAFRFSAGRASHRGRFVQTKKRLAEEKAGRLVYPSFGTAIRDAPVMRPDDLNTANINLLPLGDEVLALWEGGSAHRLDPGTLETLGLKVWNQELKGVPFSAHYKQEPDGTIWNFGVTLDRKLVVLYRIAADGTLIGAEAVPLPELPFIPAVVHDFAVTERHLVFALSPFTFEPEVMADGALLDGFVWRPELGLQVLTIAKDDTAERHLYTLPTGFTFHFGNAWEESDGTICFTYCVAENGSILTETLRSVMRGEWRPPDAPTRFARVVLRPGGKAAAQETAPFAAEFPRIAPAAVSRRHRYEYFLLGESWDWDSDENASAYTGAGRGLARFDHETGDIVRFDYGPGIIPEEHVFVPKPGGRTEDDGWLLGTSLDIGERITRLSVFDATAPADGPIAQAALPYPLPLGLHGQWRAG